jgi:magnesium-transporting ATPase (P-type)
MHLIRITVPTSRASFFFIFIFIFFGLYRMDFPAFHSLFAFLLLHVLNAPIICIFYPKKGMGDDE